MAIHHPTTADNHPVTLWRWRPVYVPGYYYSTGLALLSHYSLNSSLGPFMTTSIPHCLSKAIHHPSALWRWRPGGPCMSRSATTTIEIFNRRHYSLNSSLGNRRSALPFAYALFALVLSCLVSLECTVPLRGLFLAHAEAGLYCTVQSITPPWAGCSGLVHLNHLGHCAALTHVLPVLDRRIVENTIRSDLSISLISLENAQIPIILLPIILLNSPFE